MAVGNQIKRLREKHKPKVSVAKAASLIGIDPERLRKWEQRDSDPTDLEDAHKIESYFGVAMGDLKDLDSFQFNRQGSFKLNTAIRMSNQPLPSERNPDDYTERIKELKDHNESLKKINESLEKRLQAIESNLNEVLANLMKNQEYLKAMTAQIKAASLMAVERSAGSDKKKMIEERRTLHKYVGEFLK